jgi:dethiobiotin synthetase
MKQICPQGLFVTGTDTGVGKTVVSAALLSTLRSGGCDAAPMKPVQTGCVKRRGRWVAPDLEYCLKAAGLRPSQTERGDMAPYCFRPACSPHLAAARAGASIRCSVIRRAFRRLSQAHEFVVVEGAGGLHVPLNKQETMLDLMVAMGLPILLVARAGLGTINHTLLSLQALRGAKLEVLGVILNQSTPGPWGFVENDNLLVIERMGAVKVLACIRYGDTLPTLPPVVRAQALRSRLFRAESQS